MPIYEYQCKDCQTKFELLRDFSKADEPAVCKSCGSDHSIRMLSKCFSANAAGGSASGCDSCSSGNCSSCGH